MPDSFATLEVTAIQNIKILFSVMNKEMLFLKLKLSVLYKWNQDSHRRVIKVKQFRNRLWYVARTFSFTVLRLTMKKTLKYELNGMTLRLFKALTHLFR